MKKKSVLQLTIFFNLLLSLIIGICGLVHSPEDSTKGIDIVPDTTVTVLRKLEAFFTGNLEWTMSPEIKPNKDDYTLDPLGREIPRSTLNNITQED